MKSRYRQLEIQIKKKLSGDFLGSFQTAFKGVGTEFESLREYIPGDSIKSIDWKTTAKLGDVHVKNYEEEKDLKVLFIIENTPSLDFGSEIKTKKELLEEIFYLLAQSSLSTGHSIGSIINNHFIDYKKGEENIIKTLSLLSEKGNDETLSTHKQLNIKNTLIFILGDSLHPDLASLKYLNIANEIIYINIFDTLEIQATNEIFETSLSSYFGNIIFGSGNKQLRYSQQQKDKIENTRGSLKKHHIEYLCLHNHSDIFLELYKFFNNYSR